MKKQLFIAVIASVMLMVMALQWWQVRELKSTIETLQTRLQASSGAVPVNLNQADAKQDSQPKRIFKLIESPQLGNGATEIGVPWDVERAMMGGANENHAGQFRDGPTTIEVSPTNPLWEQLSSPELNTDAAPKSEPKSN